MMVCHGHITSTYNALMTELFSEFCIAVLKQFDDDRLAVM